MLPVQLDELLAASLGHQTDSRLPTRWALEVSADLHVLELAWRLNATRTSPDVLNACHWGLVRFKVAVSPACRVSLLMLTFHREFSISRLLSKLHRACPLRCSVGTARVTARLTYTPRATIIQAQKVAQAVKQPRKNRLFQSQPSEPQDETKVIGYARVSTRDQDPQLQINALREAGCVTIYHETASGASKRRPQYEACMKDLRAGDTLVIWKLDRLGRSTRQVLDAFAKLDERGVKIRCITQHIDTSTAMGRLVVVILAAVAEMERELGLERTRAGLARAKAEGRTGGARSKWTDIQILTFAKSGIRPGAKLAEMSVSGFQKRLKQARARTKEKPRVKRKA